MEILHDYIEGVQRVWLNRRDRCVPPLSRASVSGLQLWHESPQEHWRRAGLDRRSVIRHFADHAELGSWPIDCLEPSEGSMLDRTGSKAENLGGFRMADPALLYVSSFCLISEAILDHS